MPDDLPPWAVVYQQTQRWLAARCLEALGDDLRALLRLAAGPPGGLNAAIIDSRTLRSTPGSRERAGYDGAKHKKGSKLHVAVCRATIRMRVSSRSSRYSGGNARPFACASCHASQRRG
jgi:hypothetical protein